jgi:hypothetical protein
MLANVHRRIEEAEAASRSPSESFSMFWSFPSEKIISDLQTGERGLSKEEARRRLAQDGRNVLEPQKRSYTLGLLLAQFKSPLIVITDTGGRPLFLPARDSRRDDHHRRRTAERVAGFLAGEARGGCGEKAAVHC